MRIERPLNERMSISLSHAMGYQELRSGIKLSFEEVISFYENNGFIVERTDSYFTTRIYAIT